MFSLVAVGLPGLNTQPSPDPRQASSSFEAGAWVVSTGNKAFPDRLRESITNGFTNKQRADSLLRQYQARAGDGVDVHLPGSPGGAQADLNTLAKARKTAARAQPGPALANSRSSQTFRARPPNPDAYDRRGRALADTRYRTWRLYTQINADFCTPRTARLPT